MSLFSSVEIGLSPRLRRLLQERKERWQAQKPSWKAYDPKLVNGKPSIVNKSQAFTQAYRAAEGRAPILRAALAFKSECVTMPVHIDEDELIVGYHIRGIASFRFAQGIFIQPWLDREDWTEEEIHASEDSLAYWEGNTCEEALERIPGQDDWKRDKEVWEGGEFGGHNVIGFNRLIQMGLPGLRDEIDRCAEKNVTDNASRDFYEAMRVTCDAIMATAQRYAAEARQLAAACLDQSRMSELEEIAQVCDRIAVQKPETLWEATQLFNFAHMLDGFEDYGRLDQDLLPYYRGDLESGRLSLDEANDILGAFMLRSRFHASIIFLSGLRPDGSDGTNELSWHILELTGLFRLPSPEIMIRYHKDSPRDFLRRVCQLTAEGHLKPAYYNDDVVVPALLRDGVSVEDARDYAAVGCNHIVIPGLTNTLPSRCLLALPCLLMAMNDGVSMKTGKQLGPRTGKPEDFSSIEDLWQAYDTQLRYFAKRMGEQGDACDRVRMERDAYALRTLLTQDCLATGLSYTKGGARYNNAEVNTDGIANVADSLAAIKRLVFEEKIVSLPELAQAIFKNFEGAEEMRLRLLNQAPKFGNDDDYVDEMAVRVNDHIFAALEEVPSIRGGHCVATPTIGMGIKMWNESIGCASPDGRRKQDPVVDSIGPAHGRDRNGPTAMLNSVAKLDMSRAVCGGTLNVRFHPSMVRGDNGPDLMLNTLRAYFNKGGLQAQIQVVDNETLIAAQERPENFRDLVVRVAGYNGIFVDLPKVIQNDIIARTAHAQA